MRTFLGRYQFDTYRMKQKSPHPADNRFITSGIATKTYSCTNDKAYYLVTVSGPVTRAGGIVDNTFSMLPGLDTINGDKCGGIDRDAPVLEMELMCVD